MANKFYGALSLVGGITGALDNINDSVLSDGDGGYVITDSERIYILHYDAADATAVNDSPRVVKPVSIGVGVGSFLITEAVVKNVWMATNNAFLKGTDTGDNEVDLLGIDSSDDTLLTAIAGQSVDIVVTGTGKIADFAATGLQFLGAGARVGEFSTDGTLAGDSDTAVPTEKAVKTYVDGATTHDLDFIGDAGGAQAVDLDTQTLTIEGGTGLASTGSAQKISLAIDSTVATLTGAQTLTNKELTTPIINEILTATGKSGATFVEDGAVTLKHNELSKLATTATGVDVTGDVAASADITGVNLEITGYVEFDAAGAKVAAWSGADLVGITGTAGATGSLSQWNADGDLVVGPAATALSNFVVATGAGVWAKKTLAEVGALLEADLDHGNLQGLSTGADHSYIDQSVVSGSTPTFTATNITGVAADFIDAITEIKSTLKSGSDVTLVTGTKGATGSMSVWNADGDLVVGPAAAGVSDFAVSTGAGVWAKKTLAETGALLEADIDHGNLQGLSTGADHSYIDQSVVAGASPAFTSAALTTPVLTTSISGSAFLDEDNMASNSAVKAASQQSIKAYADTKADTFLNSYGSAGTWTVNHNLGVTNVTVKAIVGGIDVTGTYDEPVITMITANQCTVGWTVATAGDVVVTA